ncbi:Isonitrile hydratase [Streptomyces sp. RB5]|uniref:Isonitrile hydratase n=1 Tax=Streptomyces smaragdinus TaxID=2585196 RepID=A0A7K0CAS8_9ACTN|nr:DJ-1/PfpI family protein [Streptomyces smaragdinus]MQY10545.1 Isonitrile hydratase [Streptomyces smaragdinus]
MQIVVVLYPRFTALDIAGPYDVLGRLPGAEVVFVAEERGLVPNENGELSFLATASFDEVTHPDLVLVPGGPGTKEQLAPDGPLVRWLRAVDPHTTWTTSVCSGSLVLAAAGFLKGSPATSHWKVTGLLPLFGAEPASERVVEAGKYITAAGVSSGIDMALTLAGRIAGDTDAQAIQLAVEYDPQPPYDAGSPAKAAPEVHAAFTAREGALIGGERD